MKVPNTTAYMRRLRPEDGGGLRGPNSGGFDHLGFGTLTFTRDPADPADPAAEPGGGPRPQGGTGDAATSTDTANTADLATSGSDDSLLGWSAAAGVGALAGGLLLLRRRGRGGA
jgi:hypothetical protein